MKIQISKNETITFLTSDEISWFNHCFIIGSYRKKIRIVREGDNLDPELDDYFSSLGDEIAAGLHFPEDGDLEEYLKSQLKKNFSSEILDFVERNLKIKKDYYERKRIGNHKSQS